MSELNVPEVNVDGTASPGRTEPKTPAPKRTGRDVGWGVAKRAFTPEEWRRVREAARGMPWERRAVRRPGVEAYQGRDTFAGRTDVEFVERTVLVLLNAQCHISVLPRLTSANIVAFPDGLGSYFDFERAKNGKQVATVVSPQIEPWVRPYLDEPKPKSEQAYDHMFEKLEERIESMFGTPIAVNAHRFRKTGGARYRDMGYNDEEIGMFMGFEKEQATTYTTRGASALMLQHLRDRGGIPLD